MAGMLNLTYKMGGIGTSSLSSDSVSQNYVNNAVSGIMWKEVVESLILYDKDTGDSVNGVIHKYLDIEVDVKDGLEGTLICLIDQQYPINNGIWEYFPLLGLLKREQSQYKEGEAFCVSDGKFADTAFVCSNGQLLPFISNSRSIYNW